jgi:hypothetical protein
LQHIAPPSGNHRLYGLYGDHAWRVRSEYRECAQTILFEIGTLLDKPA